MSDILLDDAESGETWGRVSRPSLAQVRAIINFMEKHPEMAQRRRGVGMGSPKVKKLWLEVSNIANSIDGTLKSTKGWIKFWSDKKRSIVNKNKRIEQGDLQGRLTQLERKILVLCDDKSSLSRKKRTVKQEPCNGDDEDSFDDTLSSKDYSNRLYPTEAEERQLNMLDKLAEVMDQQSGALRQIAQASLSHAKALERVAEASNIQALAVGRLSGTFETIGASVHDVRNAIIGIDYTMKRCYPANATQQRQNSNIF